MEWLVIVPVVPAGLLQRLFKRLSKEKTCQLAPFLL